MTTRLIVWRECDSCGTDWPFPHADALLDREWKCQVCIEAEYAEWKRRMMK